MRFVAMTAALLAVTAVAGPAGTGSLSAAPAASRIEVPTLQYKERKLANGLRVISMRDTSTANVSVSVWYEIGSKHDPEGRSGFAHLFEHILSRKTRNMPCNMINRLFEDVGDSGLLTASGQTKNRLVGADRATLVIVGDSAKFIDKLRAVRPDVEVIRFDELDLDSPTLRKTG
jgi:hypothetical protein